MFDNYNKRHRNQGLKDMVGLGGLAKVIADLPDGRPPHAEPQMFQLPSQQRRSVPVWKVLLAMAIVLALIAWRLMR